MRILRLIPMLLLVAVLGACGSKSSSSAGPAATPGLPTVDISLQDFMIMPMTVTTGAGNVSFHVHNDGKTPHNFKIRQNGTIVGGSKDLNPGKSQDVTIPLQKGAYDGFCAESGHESLGMHNTVTVS